MDHRPALSVSKSLLIGALVGLLAACADPPELDSRIDPALEQASYPDLVPVDQLLGPNAPDPEADVRTADRLESRAAALQSRARQLQRQEAVDAETRRRLNSDNATD